MEIPNKPIDDKWLIKEGDLDLEKANIKELDPIKTKGFIVKGSAGSGKTLLALHKAKELQELKNGTVYLVVYTKALKAFIADAIKDLGLDNVKVLYEWEFAHKVILASVDYLIIDEVQDFDVERIKGFQSKAKKALMLFGDTAQLLYENGTTMNEIETITNLPSYGLKNNYRLTKVIAKFAQNVLPDHERDFSIVDKCKREGDLPIVRKCKDPEDEMSYILKQLEEGITSVAILLPNNTLVNAVYQYLNENGQTAEVRMTIENDNGTKTSIDTLNFRTNSPKIMTYHSSKGLQFKNVFIPFCNISGSINFRRALYVAMTRTSNNLHISYNPDYPLSQYINNIPSNLYNDIQ